MSSKPASPQRLVILVATRKGAWLFHGDAGRKTYSADGVNPKPLGIGGFSRIGFSAEHTTIELDAPAAKPAIGDRLEFIVGYGDITVHLHDTLYGVRGDIVEAEWPILARGKLA